MNTDEAVIVFSLFSPQKKMPMNNLLPREQPQYYHIDNQKLLYITTYTNFIICDVQCKTNSIQNKH